MATHTKRQLKKIALVVTAESKITKTNIPAPQYSPDNLILRACIKGKVDTSNNYTEINGRWYEPLSLKAYI